jgi:hypothetical protein
MQLASELAEATGHFALRQTGQLADRADTPTTQRRGRIELRREPRQRQRRQELRFLARFDDDRRMRQLCRYSRCQFARRDADTRGEAHARGGVHGRFAECDFGQGVDGVLKMPLHPRHVDKHDSFAGIFDARGERFRHFEQRFLRGALAFGVAWAGDQLGDDRARLRQRHAGNDSFRSCATRGRDDMGVLRVAVDDGQRFLQQIGLAA